ncbi:MEDS domain-containing protein [Mesobacillus sp. AQ2]|uniref:MEDS domain-containing protein n=1 Tax=Bacillaceae TaxID=186817 RepID=UPI0011A305F5|nr:MULTISPECIES: MEDS domain-containing protein [Bacillaceae]WHX41072.1 MEDS domain-containing protein [Mesobacillus sp. AQ2]
MKYKMAQMLGDQKNVHILYSYDGMRNYIEQAIRYIEEGVLSGDYVILIENDRIYKILHAELNKRLTSVQMELVHWVNNFDFYYSSGSYHPPAITEYFQKTVQPYVENEISFRSWAHVEWASIKEPLNIIEDFERIVDDAVNELFFPLICAYQGVKMPEHLRKILMETHPYVLLEDELVPSEQYSELETVLAAEESK